MTKDEARHEAARLWMLKADEALRAARNDLEISAASTINRAYYACFYAVSAILLTRNIEHSKHSGVRADFNLHFIHTEILDKKHGKFYNKMFDSRNQSDYNMLTLLDKDTVIIWHNCALDLIEDIEAHIRKSGDTVA